MCADWSVVPSPVVLWCPPLLAISVVSIESRAVLPSLIIPTLPIELVSKSPSFDGFSIRVCWEKFEIYLLEPFCLVAHTVCESGQHAQH